MPIKLSNLTATSNVESTDVEWAGEVVTVRYTPARLTAAHLDEVMEAAEGNRGDMAVVHILAHVLESWDVLDDEGQQLPVTVEVLRTLPIPFLGAVLEGIQGAMTPGEANAEPSSFG